MGHFSEEKQGVLYTAASYLLWGVLPLYWKLLEARPALEILAHRIIWSFAFMIILLAATGQLGAWRREIRAMRRQPALAWGIAAAAVLISANWFIYIWAVNHRHIVEFCNTFRRRLVFSLVSFCSANRLREPICTHSAAFGRRLSCFPLFKSSKRQGRKNGSEVRLKHKSGPRTGRFFVFTANTYFCRNT